MHRATITNNKWIVLPGGQARVFPRPWVSDDPRPRCVLILGDGFTQGFLHHYGLEGTAPSRVSAHFPSPAGKPYFPVPGDRFGTEPSELWDARKWDDLFKAWDRLGGGDPYGFYQRCASERISSTVNQGTWSFNTGSLAYQLRAYLWHFFVSFQRVIDKDLIDRPLLFASDSWLWSRLIKLLDTDFRLAVVTFNYDLVAKRIIIALIGGRVVCSV